MSIDHHQSIIREQFAHVDHCPVAGPRIFFENAGGALTLKSVLKSTQFHAALPDNQGRDNATSHALDCVIQDSKRAIHTFFQASGGQVFVGESGTELLFRLIRTALTEQRTKPHASVISSTIEHPATRSAAHHWAGIFNMPHILVPHDSSTGRVEPSAYRQHLHKDMVLATILQTSPVTGIGNDVAAIAAEIRQIAPQCFIIVDGIQHACHGLIDLDAYDIDGYVISPYKVFSRHGYGLAWVSERLSEARLEQLRGGSEQQWELGTRDTGAYATMHEVIKYFSWLAQQVTPNKSASLRENILAAAKAIHAHEHALCEAMLHGCDNHRGLAEYNNITIIGGIDNRHRAGLVCFYHRHLPSAEIVARLNAQGIRTHTRKDDHYSGNILKPLHRKDAVRVSLCHYNSHDEISQLLVAIRDIL